MTTYLARLIEDKQLVGIFSVKSDSELFWLVDECCDPGAVEITDLGTGGVFWGGSDAPKVPAIVDQDGEGGLNGLPNGSTISEGWRDVFEADEGDLRGTVWKPVPRE